MTHPLSLVPSLPAQSFEEILALAEALEHVTSELQIDIVDGQFVPAVAWPFTEAEPTKALLKLQQISGQFVLEMDCMVVAPEQYLDHFVEVAAKRVIIHFGSTTTYATIFAHAKEHGYKLGLAFTNDADLDEVINLIPHFSFVQVMGIAVVGKQGQPFDKRTLKTIQILRATFPKLEIAVDGSVNEETILSLKEAGATRFAPGSAIAKQADPKAAYQALMNLITYTANL